jgi:hypothetical protein
MERKGIPFTIVVLKLCPVGFAGSAMVVDGIMTNGVPLMSVVLPRPGGRPAAGTVIVLGIAKKDVPPMTVKLPRLAGIGCVGRMASVVALDMMTNGVPPIRVVSP